MAGHFHPGLRYRPDPGPPGSVGAGAAVNQERDAPGGGSAAAPRGVPQVAGGLDGEGEALSESGLQAGGSAGRAADEPHVSVAVHPRGIRRHFLRFREPLPGGGGQAPDC